MIQGMPNCRGAVLTTLALLITLAVAPPSPLFAAPRSAPAHAADPVVAQILQMLQGGVSEPVITTWLDKSGARPAAVGSADLVALHKAGASDALMQKLIALAAEPAPAPPASAPPPAAAAPPATAAPSPPPPTAAPSAPPPAPLPSAPAPAAPATTAPAPAAVPPPPHAMAPVAPSSATAATGAGGVTVHYSVTYRPVFLEDEERYGLSIYVDGKLVGYVQAAIAVLPLPARTFDADLAPGRHVLRVVQDRRIAYRTSRGYTSPSRLDPSDFPFELQASPTAEISIHFGEKSFRHPGPVAVHVRQNGKDLLQLEPPAPNPEAWAVICEDIPPSLPKDGKQPAGARRDLEHCQHWADLWAGIAGVPSRDEIRAQIERLSRPAPMSTSMN